MAIEVIMKRASVRGTHQGYIDITDSYENGILLAVCEMMRLAEVDPDQEIWLLDDDQITTIGNQLDFEKVIAGIDWVYARYEYNEAVYHFGKKMIELTFGTDKPGWDITAMMADGKEYYASNEFNGVRLTPPKID